ncbi:DUF2971 domain-containing protein [Thermosulfurimonas sp. F29]|uniref:DUF2971 domain-containing protein n=1 Tax=Thermosulfurimonas sp. F29 TaxID=2867247 RepID=UPI001C838492|nr:DUF2971 domain-containing protein [Thermosulfurimonas sp. F29]MBX6422001.1 DUF2971 domain-containing protein [Thermosulfurimonas sp. F29]
MNYTITQLNNTMYNKLNDFIENTKFGFLRAAWTASSGYLKKYGDIFYYRGDLIFHYTDLNGLIGILTNKGFWLSDARYLNDAEELYNGANLAKQLIKKLISKQRYNHFKKVLEDTLEKLETSSFENHYICSFTMVADTLEHWRAYGENGAGICIGFSLKQKTEYPHFFLFPQYYVGKVIYKDQQKTEILLSIIHKYNHEFMRDLKENKYNIKMYNEEYVNAMFHSLSSVFVNFKNKAFQTEQEVRLIDSSGNLDFYEKKRYRVSNGVIVPYVCTYETKLKDSSGKRIYPDKLPITKIIVGPLAKQNIIIQSIKDFLNDLGYSDVEILKSKIPYRG